MIKSITAKQNRKEKQNLKNISMLVSMSFYRSAMSTFQIWLFCVTHGIDLERQPNLVLLIALVVVLQDCIRKPAPEVSQKSVE